MPVILIRTILSYILVVLSIRLMGKKQLGELQPSELVTTILISNIATLSLENPDLPMLSGIIPILSIVCLDIIVSLLSLKSDKFRRVVTGSPRVIIKNGKINQQELKKLRYTLHDLAEAARDAGVFELSSVQYAVVENTGKINILETDNSQSPESDSPSAESNMQSPESDSQSAEGGIVSGDTPPQSETSADPPVMAVCDGKVDKEALKEIGLDEKGLHEILARKKIPLSRVFLLTADEKGKFYIIEKEE